MRRMMLDGEVPHSVHYGVKDLIERWQFPIEVGVPQEYTDLLYDLLSYCALYKSNSSSNTETKEKQ